MKATAPLPCPVDHTAAPRPVARREFARPTLALLAALLLVVAGAPDAQAAPDQAPPDTVTYVEIHDLAALRARLSNEPIVTWLMAKLPHPDENQGWVMIQSALGLSTPQILDTYFGSEVVVLSNRPGHNQPSVILSRVSRPDMDAAIERLQLAPDGRVGDFDLYLTADGKGCFAFSSQWMALGNSAARDYLRQVLTHSPGDRSLAQDADFQALTRTLPARPAVLLYVHDEHGQPQALAADLSGSQITVTYAGRPHRAQAWLPRLAAMTPTVDAPLSTGALATVGFQLDTAQLPTRSSPLIDRMLAPHTVQGDVLPKLSGQVVLALGQGDAASAAAAPTGDTASPTAARPTPALLVALQLKDPSVATDLQRLLDTFMVILNVQGAAWNAPPITPIERTYTDATYHAAPVGLALAARTGRPELESLQLVYGRIGSWYVLTTNENQFRAAVDAGHAALAPPTAGAALLAGTHAAASDTAALGSATVHSHALAARLQDWIAYWQAQRPELLEAAQTQPVTPEGKFARAVVLAYDVLDRLGDIHLDLTRIDDRTVGATLTVNLK